MAYWFIAMLVSLIFLVLLISFPQAIIGILLIGFGYAIWEYQLKEDIKNEIKEENNRNYY